MNIDEYKVLDEVLSYLNEGIMHLDHKSNLINTYGKLSHQQLRGKPDTGFYKFHDEIIKNLKSVLKPYGLNCELFGVYNDKNTLLTAKRLCTVVIQKGKLNDNEYSAAVEKLMVDNSTDTLLSVLNKASNKVQVIDVNYCYTKAYKIYSIDVVYIKNE